MPDLFVKFSIGDFAYTCIDDLITKCEVTQIVAIVDNSGTVTVANTMTNDAEEFIRNDDVCFTSASDCATYLLANVDV